MNQYLIKKRIAILIVVFIMMFSAIALRMGYITFFMANDVNGLAEELWSRNIPISGSRGLIYDRNGTVIVGNELAFTVASINRQVDDKNKTAIKLAEILDADYHDIYAHLAKSNSIEIIKPEGRRISKEQAQAIVEADMDGIYITSDSKRSYPYDTMLGQVLGFTGIDMDGLSGVEYMYDEYLQSQTGALQVYTDAKGNLMQDATSVFTSTTPGMDVYLTVDINLQTIMDNVINNAIAMYNPEQVMGLMVSAKTGEVLAMTSYPYFSPANYQDYSSEIINRNLPIFNSFELGSTFKIFTYSVALELGLFDMNEHFHCSGSRVVGGRKIKCWKAGGHGSQTFLEVIQNSCNPGFMELGERIGVENFYKYLDLYGFTEKTGIDLNGESKGITVSKDICGTVELATQSFGQASAYTPIQLAMASIAAVTGGDLLQPYILKQIQTYANEVVYENQKTVKRNVISSKTSSLMQYALENVSALGTGRNAFIEGYRVGGKTGTAQKISDTGGYKSGEYILSYIGMAPMDDPEVLIYLAIDYPKNVVQYGGTVAAPLAGEILEQALTYLNVERDYENQIEKNLRWFIDSPTYKVADYIGLTRKEIKPNSFYKYVYYGDGDTVVYQSPAAGEKIKEGDTIMLYLG